MNHMDCIQAAKYKRKFFMNENIGKNFYLKQLINKLYLLLFINVVSRWTSSLVLNKLFQVNLSYILQPSGNCKWVAKTVISGFIAVSLHPLADYHLSHNSLRLTPSLNRHKRQQLFLDCQIPQTVNRDAASMVVVKTTAPFFVSNSVR